MESPDKEDSIMFDQLFRYPAELSAQKMSLDYPLCASQAAFSIVT